MKLSFDGGLVEMVLPIGVAIPASRPKLLVVGYNFVRIHKTLRTTPAMVGDRAALGNG